MDDYDRRHFIRTSIPGFLGLSLALPSITALATKANAFQGRVKENGAINWDAFLTTIEKEAAKQHVDNWNEPEYVAKIAALAKRLNLQDPKLAKAFQTAQKGGIGNERIDFYKLDKQMDFAVTLVQFEEEEEISHHDHPEMTGVLLCATGEVDVWNYDLLGKREKKDEFLLQQTSFATLDKGNVSTLTAKERNIHRLKAKKLTQLVDIFTPPYDDERIRKSMWFDVDPEGYMGNEKFFLAKKR